MDGLAAWADEGSTRRFRFAADYEKPETAASIAAFPAIRPREIKRVIVIGSDRMMAAVAAAHADWLAYV